MRWMIALIAAACTAPAPTQPPDGSPGARLLAIHNRERAEIGVPPLRWSDALAADAAAYARRLAARGDFEHSPQDERPDQGENLAMGTLGYYSPEALAELWTEEQGGFPGGAYPDPAEDDWSDIGHYTQMVWRGTTHIGCATAAGRSNLYLVCRYAPVGNVIGERVY
jgi:hypothetical protein